MRRLKYADHPIVCDGLCIAQSQDMPGAVGLAESPGRINGLLDDGGWISQNGQLPVGGVVPGLWVLALPWEVRSPIDRQVCRLLGADIVDDHQAVGRGVNTALPRFRSEERR